jgi:GGDEF domain-containing protein
VLQAVGLKQVRPPVLVIAPVAVLTLISASIMGLLLQRSGPEVGTSWAIVVTGGLAYAVAGDPARPLRPVEHRPARGSRPDRQPRGDAQPPRAALDYVRCVEGQEKALALIDLDGFKSINDQYGHFVGDRLIKDAPSFSPKSAATRRAATGSAATSSRSFVAGPIAGNILEGVCHTLIARLSKSLLIDDRKLTVGASIGLSRSSGRDGLSSSELLRRSDMAMYASKEGGKNRCTWFTEDFDRTATSPSRSRKTCATRSSAASSCSPTSRWSRPHRRDRRGRGAAALEAGRRNDDQPGVFIPSPRSAG